MVKYILCIKRGQYVCDAQRRIGLEQGVPHTQAGVEDIKFVTRWNSTCIQKMRGRKVTGFVLLVFISEILSDDISSSFSNELSFQVYCWDKSSSSHIIIFWVKVQYCFVKDSSGIISIRCEKWFQDFSLPVLRHVNLQYFAFISNASSRHNN